MLFFFINSKIFRTFVGIMLSRKIFSLVVLPALCLLLSCNASLRQRNDMAEHLLAKGDSLYRMEQYSEATDCLLQSIALAKQTGNAHCQARSIIQLAMIYVRLNDMDRAGHYLNMAIKLATSKKDYRAQGEALGHLTAVYAYQHDLKKAEQCLDRQRKLPGQSEGLRLYYLYFNEALLCQLKGNADRSLALYDRAMQIVRQYKLSQSLLCSVIGIKVYAYLAMGDTRKALKTCEQFRQSGKLQDNRVYQAAYYEMLRDIHHAMGKEPEARAYAAKADSVSVAIISQRQIDAVDNKVVRFDDQQNMNDIEQLTSVVNMQWMVIALFVSLIVMLALLAVTIYRHNKRIRHTYLLLVRKNRDIIMQEKINRKLMQPSSADDDALSDVPVADDKATKLSKEHVNELVKKIAAVMNDVQKISQPDFSLNLLAREVGSNTAYVSWVINNIYHHNFKAFLNEYRIREACRRMDDHEHYGHITIQALIKDLGYSSYSNFVAAFKKVNGMTPSQYQRLSVEADEDK